MGRAGRARLPGAPDEPGYCEAARRQLDFLVHAHKLQQLVLITHYGCAYYGHRLERPAKECLPAQIKDMRVAAALFREWYPGMEVEAYLAMRREACLSFHGLDL